MKRVVTLAAAVALALGIAACESEQFYGEGESGRTDAAITAEVQRELGGEGLSGNIEVAATNGVVTLSGTVPDADSKERAEEIAQDIDGVDSVRNNLRTMAGDAPQEQQRQQPGARAPQGQRAPQPGLDSGEEAGEDAGM